VSVCVCITIFLIYIYIHTDIDIKKDIKGSEKLPRTLTTDVCTYKLLKNVFAKSMKPPIKKWYI